MPIPAYAKFEGIPGSVKVQGREDMVEVLAYEHESYIPMTKTDSTASGLRKHLPIKLTKVYDKSSPKLYECLWNGKVIPRVEIHWFEIDKIGKETEYYTHILEQVRVVKVRAWMPESESPLTEHLKHMEDVELRYEKITVKFVDGNIEASDSWQENR